MVYQGHWRGCSGPSTVTSKGHAAVSFIKPKLTQILLVTGYLDYLKETHNARVDARQFSGAVFAYLRAVHGIDSNELLGVTGMDEGPFAGCPVCAQIPAQPHAEQEAGKSLQGRQRHGRCQSFRSREVEVHCLPRARS